jgi:hypothetical protein
MQSSVSSIKLKQRGPNAFRMGRVDMYGLILIEITSARESEQKVTERKAKAKAII